MTMGSPLGPTVTDVFLSTIETEFNDCISEMVSYKQFVDDVFSFTESISFVSILKLFNSPHLNLSVSYEEEGSECSKFFDIKLRRRSNETIKRSIHKNST